MRPIPRSMLCHTAQLLTVTADSYGLEATALYATLEYVHVAIKGQDDHTQLGTRREYRGLLIYDTRTSVPPGVTFALGQRVRYAGTLYRIEAIRPLYDGQRLHHYEVTLGV